jgi:hypothetical protein
MTEISRDVLSHSDFFGHFHKNILAKRFASQLFPDRVRRFTLVSQTEKLAKWPADFLCAGVGSGAAMPQFASRTLKERKTGAPSFVAWCSAVPIRKHRIESEPCTVNTLAAGDIAPGGAGPSSTELDGTGAARRCIADPLIFWAISKPTG